MATAVSYHDPVPEFQSNYSATTRQQIKYLTDFATQPVYDLQPLSTINTGSTWDVTWTQPATTLGPAPAVLSIPTPWFGIWNQEKQTWWIDGSGRVIFGPEEVMKAQLMSIQAERAGCGMPVRPESQGAVAKFGKDGKPDPWVPLIPPGEEGEL